MGLDLSKTATALLKKLGGEFTILSPTNVDIDPDSGLPIYMATWEERTVFGALVEYSEPNIDGTNIKAGDKVLIVEQAAEIKKGDVAVIYSEKWTIVDPNPINPSGIVQVYEMQVRKQ